MFASKAKRGFFDENVHASIPSDAVNITAEAHAALMDGQAQGKVIEWGDDGYPVLVEPPPPSMESLEKVERAWRDAQLAATDGVVSRHRDELESEQETTLNAGQYTELQAYRRVLRNWPEAGEFPLIDHRPIAPPWLIEQFQ